MPESDNKYLGLGLLIFIFFFAHLGVGLVHINDCPRQPFIPIYLCGFGALFLLMLFCLAAYSNMSNKCNMGCFWGTIAVFFCWFFAGSITIYSIFEPNYEKTRHPDSYCNKILYLFAFWSTNLINGVTFSYLSYYCCKQVVWKKYKQTRTVFPSSGPSPSEVSSYKGKVQTQDRVMFQDSEAWAKSQISSSGTNTNPTLI